MSPLLYTKTFDQTQINRQPIRCAEHNLTGRMVPSTLFNASKIMFQILPAHSCSSPVYLTVGVDATGGGRALSRHQGHCDQAQDHGPQHCPHQPHPWHGQRRGVIKWVWKKQANFPKSDNDNVPLKWQCLKLQTHRWILWLDERCELGSNWAVTELERCKVTGSDQVSEVSPWLRRIMRNPHKMLAEADTACGLVAGEWLQTIEVR